MCQGDADEEEEEAQNKQTINDKNFDIRLYDFFL